MESILIPCRPPLCAQIILCSYAELDALARCIWKQRRMVRSAPYEGFLSEQHRFIFVYTHKMHGFADWPFGATEERPRSLSSFRRCAFLSCPVHGEYQMLVISEERKYQMFGTWRDLSYRILEGGTELRRTGAGSARTNKVYALSHLTFISYGQAC
jgi:hypothetical protein